MKLLQYLSKVNIYIFLIFAILARMFFEFFYFDLCIDKTLQLASVINFINGFGVSELKYNGEFITTPLCQWPIGYFLVIFPFFKLTNDILFSSLLVDLIFSGLLVISLFLIMKKFLRDNHIKLILLFYAFLINPFQQLFSPDLISLVLFLIGIAFLLNFHYKSSSISLYLSIVFFAITPFFKYSYFFISYFTLFTLLYLYLVQNIKTRLKYILVSFVIPLTFSIALLITNKILFGTYLWGGEPGKGIFLKNILYFDNFILKSFFDYKTLINRILFHTSTIQLFNILSFLISLFLILYFIKFTIKSHTNKTNLFFLNSLLVSCLILNCSILIYLSITKPPQTSWTEHWTYVGENRYYVPSMILIQLFVIAYLIELNKIWPKKFLFMFLIINLCYSCYFYATNYKHSYQQYKMQNFKTIINIINENKKINKIAVLESDAENQTFDILYSQGLAYKPLLDNNLENYKKLTCPTFIILSKKNSGFTKEFIQMYSNNLIYNDKSEYIFYFKGI